VPKGSSIRGPADIADKRIAVQRDDIGHEFLRNNGIGAALVVVDDLRKQFDAVQRGDADCAVLSLLQGSRAGRDKSYATLRSVGAPLFRAEYCITVREGYRELQDILNESLSTVRVNGDYDAIYKRWFGNFQSGIADNRIIGIMEAMVATAMTLAGLATLWAAAALARKKQAAAALVLESRRHAETQDRLRVALAESESARLEAMEAVRDRSSFIASVSHELRAPLHGILGAAERLSNTKLDDEQAATLSMARSSAAQLNRVLSGLLESAGNQASLEANLAACSQPKAEAVAGRPEASCVEGAVATASPPGGTRGYGKAIVAEDEAINRIHLKRVLETAGIEVRQAVDGKAALDAASDGSWSFILMDVSMPRMDGLEATRSIRALEAARGAGHVPIIALTAHSTAEDREACARAGMDGFLSKPFSEQALWLEVDKTIATLGTSSAPQGGGPEDYSTNPAS
ncbi:MAG: hypothetical protein CVV51_13075, partial [Spirochaetae bacterium HGW-Spirochaetae-7]